MAASDEIRSTEKLLNLIRTPSQPKEVTNVSPDDSRRSRVKQTPSIQSFRLKKKFTVGVDIGHTYIRIAKTRRLAEKEHELLDYLNIPLSHKASLNDPVVLDKLKSGLDQICDNERDCDIWSAIPAAKVEMRYLQIPKLQGKEIPNAVFWSFTKKIAFNEEEESLDYEILGDTVLDGVPKIEILAFKTPKAETEAVKDAFEEIGYPLTGISVAPFAIQNLFRAGIIDPEEKDICCLYVGRDWSRIAIYSNGDLMLSRGIKAGMRSMVEAIDIALRKQNGTWTETTPSSDENNADAPQETVIPIQPTAQKKFFDLLGEPDGARTPDAQQERNRLYDMILPALERLIRQVERTFEHFGANFQRDYARRIYLSGQITANAMIVNHFSRQLEMPVEVMNPFTPGSPFVRPINIPDTQDERESYAPAIGLAVSSKDMTPNCLFTQRQRNQEENIRRINMRILTGSIVVLMILLALFSLQGRRLDGKRRQIDQLNQRLMAYSPPADKQILLALYSQNQNKQKIFQGIVQRYAPVAVVNELAQITPPNVRLIDIKADFDNRVPQKKNPTRQVTVEGIIFGAPENFEAVLTGYLLNLKNSPIFNKPSILKKSKEFYSDQEILRFSARLELI